MEQLLEQFHPNGNIARRPKAIPFATASILCFMAPGRASSGVVGFSLSERLKQRIAFWK